MSVVMNATRSTSIMAKRTSYKEDKESLIERGLREPSRLSIQLAPKFKESSHIMGDQERKRREAIDEIIHTERDFVRDLEYLRDRWVEPLRTWGIIPEDRRPNFVQQVFGNIEDILDISIRLYGLLNKRQNVNPTIETIGDIFAELVPHFQSFVEYGSRQPHGKHEFEKEKSINTVFATFVETVERLPESRRLGLSIYLIKPAIHLARYLPMLEAVLKHTSENKPDRTAIPQVMKMIREFLAKLYEGRDKAEYRLKMTELEKRLVFRPGEEVELGLMDKQRHLVHHGSLECRRGSASSNKSDVLYAFLFDHALLLVKSNMVGKDEHWEVFKRPIPLELLAVLTSDENTQKAPKPRLGSPENQRRLIVRRCGRNGYTLTLWAPNAATRDQWVERITARQQVFCEQNMLFKTYTLSEGFFLGDAVNCVVPYGEPFCTCDKPKLMRNLRADSGRRFAYGAGDGIYFQSLHHAVETPIRKIALPNVQQIEILEDYELLVALVERSVVTIPLEAINVDGVGRIEDPLERMKRIASHTSFFKAGYCLGRTLVCIAKASSMVTTIKVFEPIELSIREKSQPTFKKLLQGGNDTLKVFKEFYMPHDVLSIHFLKTKLCVACTTGFVIVDLKTMETQPLLDPADVSLDFVQRRPDVRPLNIYRIGDEFLLCYTEFAFFVNKSGWRSKKGVIIYWEGTPNGFALHYPYLMAFDSTFIEIRHVEDGQLIQVGGGKNMRLLFADTQPSVKNPLNPVVSAPRAHARDEIILASEDKVMAVRPARLNHSARCSVRYAN
ncbi:unnamed protein product [Rhizoctonia solani]|uniref:Rho1 guanine nucleotide exchange factor 1 [Schizosaccharomyces pombe 972h-] n=1 Tax=Rhizoctonia solani TaxID=456999 RepID=A0A8H3DWZ5_9AGAM|nr:unnamed protein product [Rhizoctonia solani]